MYYVNSNIKNLYRVSYKESRKGYLKLDMNENPDGLPDYITNDILKAITKEEFSMYPENHELIFKLSNDLACKEENICLTNGSDDGIRMIIQSFGKPGSKFISVSPTFEMYSVYAKMYGLEVFSIEYNKDFLIDFNNIFEAIDEDTSLVLLLNPNSPIGKVWTNEEVMQIIDKAQKNEAIVIIDEAYFYFNKSTFISAINTWDNVIILRTFSKAFSIAGCRIGYAISNEKIINLLKKCSSSYPINILAIKAAEYLLKNNEIIDEFIKKTESGRDYIIENLKKNNYEYSYNYGNYLLIKTRKTPTEVFEKLKEKKILVKKYTNKTLNLWIRITIGSVESMSLFWKEFEKIDLN